MTGGEKEKIILSLLRCHATSSILKEVCLHFVHQLITIIIFVSSFLVHIGSSNSYSGQFLAFLKSCETQDKFPNFLRDLQDLQDSKNFQFFLLFLSFQPEKVINFTTNIFYVLKQCIFLNKSHKRQNKNFFC